MSNIVLTSSFIQNQKHACVSDKYKPVSGLDVAELLRPQGFDMVHLKTGHAKHEDKQDFQTTVSRYRSIDMFEVDGLHLDVILKNPHLGRGCSELVGLFRGVCSNQLAVGYHFETVKVRHIGNPMAAIEQGIATIMSQRAQLVETINQMKSMQLNVDQVCQLAGSIAKIRLADVKNIVSLDLRRLIIPRRKEDTNIDLFTVFNIIQENVIRFGFEYKIESVDNKGYPVVRNQTTRKMNDNAVSTLEFNRSIFDKANELLKNVA